MSATLGLEARQVYEAGIPTGFYHLYIVYNPDSTTEPWEVIHGTQGAGSILEASYDSDLEATFDSRGALAPNDRGFTEILSGSEAARVWELMQQHVLDIDAANLNYELNVLSESQTSNSVVASTLYTFGFNIADFFPLVVEGDDVGLSNTPGTENLLIFSRTIDGSGAADYIRGYSSPDSLSGGGGDDLLTGGSGNDSLAGGTDNDTYECYTTDIGTTTIDDDGINSVAATADVLKIDGTVIGSDTPSSESEYGTLASGYARLDDNEDGKWHLGDYVLRQVNGGADLELDLDANHDGIGDGTNTILLKNFAMQQQNFAAACAAQNWM